jgi:hypothetical protein
MATHLIGCDRGLIRTVLQIHSGMIRISSLENYSYVVIQRTDKQDQAELKTTRTPSAFFSSLKDDHNYSKASADDEKQQASPDPWVFPIANVDVMDHVYGASDKSKDTSLQSSSPLYLTNQLVSVIHHSNKDSQLSSSMPDKSQLADSGTAGAPPGAGDDGNDNDDDDDDDMDREWREIKGEFEAQERVRGRIVGEDEDDEFDVYDDDEYDGDDFYDEENDEYIGGGKKKHRNRLHERLQAEKEAEIRNSHINVMRRTHRQLDDLLADMEDEVRATFLII